MPDLVLTVNLRLARRRLLLHNQQQKAAKLQAWPTPEIHHLDSWLKDAWKQSLPERYLLSDLQSQTVWENIIRRDPESPQLDLLHLEECAGQAAKAYALIHEYCLPTDASLYQWTNETAAFHRWKRLYDKRVEALGALDSARLMNAVAQAMENGQIPIPEKVRLAGFDEITPQLQNWIERLRQHGSSVQIEAERASQEKRDLPTLAQGKNVRVAGYQDRKSEAIQCARWIRSRFAPGKSIGVVVTEMDPYRAMLRRELMAELMPRSIFPWEEAEIPFDISLGSKLAEEPLVRVAMQIVSAPKAALPLALFSFIIKSPFIASGENHDEQVGHLDLQLRKNKIGHVHLAAVIDRYMKEGANDLRKLLNAWNDFLGSKGSRNPSDWVKEFDRCLRKMGWPGSNRTLSSREYQVLEAWQESLASLASLDTISGRMSRSQAAATLCRLLKGKTFQIKTREQPIQVLDFQESAGMQFDHLWVMGCHADIFPPSPSPNPFLPWDLKKKHNLPHCTAQRELEFAENILLRLLASSDAIVFSHPQWDGTTELRRSSLLNSFADPQDSSIEILSQSHRVRDRFESPGILETFSEPVVLSLSEAEKTFYRNEAIHGGYGVIKDQSDCPFRAFAAYRLGAVSVELPEHDFDAGERGTLIHKTLEIFWGKTKNSANLKQSIDANELEERIEQCVQEAITKYTNKLPGQSRFLELEKKRTQSLVRDWIMEQESLRSPFEVMEEEKEVAFSLGGLNLILRIDRIDKLDGGSVLILDYKTGDIKLQNWYGERPKEPQLPLYAATAAPQGLGIAQIKRGNLKLSVVSDPDRPIPGLKSGDFFKKTDCRTWKQLLRYWRTNLSQLAQRFLAGESQVDPQKEAETCRYCQFPTLCRIRERDGIADDSEEME